ncbi:MAG: GTP 3',8-cyclase MoaA [Oscillospiraceae bacterium]
MTDSFGREITYLRVSVTELCNLRCKYCMPPEGICKKRHSDMMTEDEMIDAVRAAASLGINKIRITGGEPLVKKNILSICRRVSAVNGINEVCLTTNGTLLSPLAASLYEAGVDRINISLDTLDAEKYRMITILGDLGDALRGIDSAFAAGFKRVKINTVLIGGFNDSETADFCALTMDRDIDVRFIELMPMVDSAFDAGAYLPCETVLERVPELVSIPGDGGVARLYQFPGAHGRVGLISPVSCHFCNSCNRLRLTADGKIKPCLHSPIEYSLKGLDMDGMREVFLRAVMKKPERHDTLSAKNMSGAGRTMNSIGG